MILTGVRIAEMCRLIWSDIDFTKKVVKITCSRLYHPEFGTYEKERSNRNAVRGFERKRDHGIAV